MNIAFYAPMKAPDRPEPSGDRTIARLLMAALVRARFDVRLASRLRTWSAVADSERLAAFEAAGSEAAAAFVASTREAADGWQPDLWFTYHVYYKAPDFVGPKVADALGIPYVVAEASYAARRAEGPWRDWLAVARAGIERADAVFNLTARDRRGIEGLSLPTRMTDLRPFVDLAAFPKRSLPLRGGGAEPVRLISVGMMRPGAKFESYRFLAAALETMTAGNWQIDIVGDGEAGAAVRAEFGRFADGRVAWHGAVEGALLHELMARAEVFVWPGIEEAFGMVYLEAQAMGLPVVALRTAGVPEVVRHGVGGLLVDEATAPAFAAALGSLIDDAALRNALGAGARAVIEQHHSLAAQSATLGRVVRALVGPP